MSASAVRDLLSITSVMFDQSDEVMEETARLYKAFEVQNKTCFSQLKDITGLSTSDFHKNYMALLVDPNLQRDISNSIKFTEEANGNLIDLMSNRTEVITARKEALDIEQKSLLSKREELEKDIKSRMKMADDDFIAKLKEIVAAKPEVSAVQVEEAPVEAAAATVASEEVNPPEAAITE